MRTFNLPIRTWLILAVIAVMVVPQVAVTVVMRVSHGLSLPARRDDLMREIVASVSSWDDPSWQEEVRQKLAAVRLSAMLTDASGRVVFRTGTDDNPPPEPPPEPPGPLPRQRPPAMVWTRSASSGPDAGAVARFWGAPDIPTRSMMMMPALVAFTATCATLALLAWLIGPAMLRPLAAMSRSARQIARGELDIDLPTSQVKEVEEVGAAFRAMGDALKESISRQAELEQERRLFIAAIVHDLRTPLFSLRGHLEGLEKGVADTPDKAQRYVAICREKAAHLDRLVSDLLSYAQMEYLELTPERKSVDLGGLLQKAAESIALLADAKGVTLSVTGPAEPCPVLADEHMLTRAVENLLDNALRYTPPGGVIRVEWRQAGDACTFSVSDSGPGFRQEDLPHLFTPLFRGEASRNRRTGGTGLGLAVARRIMRAHGGDLTAGNAPSGGAVLTAVLPAE